MPRSPCCRCGRAAVPGRAPASGLLLLSRNRPEWLAEGGMVWGSGGHPPHPTCPRAGALQWARLTPNRLCRSRQRSPQGQAEPRPPPARAMLPALRAVTGSLRPPRTGRRWHSGEPGRGFISPGCRGTSGKETEAVSQGEGFFLVTLGRGGQARAACGNPCLLSVPSVQLRQLRLHQDRGQRLPRGPDRWQGPHGRRR